MNETVTRRYFLSLAGLAAVGSVALNRDAPPLWLAARRNVGLSTWVWHPEGAATLIDSAKSVGVGRLLLWAPPNLSSDGRRLTAWRRLATTATQAGMRVDALGGDPSWALHPELARSWAADMKRLGLAERLHLDIEPDALGLSAGRAVSAYSGMLDCLSGARTQGLPLDVDVAAHYARRQATRSTSFLQEIMLRCDSVTIMAYRSRAAQILDFADDSLTQVRSSGRTAWLGVNLTDPGNDAPATVLTYRGGDPAAEVARLRDLVQRRPEIAGIALHDSRFLGLLRK